MKRVPARNGTEQVYSLMKCREGWETSTEISVFKAREATIFTLWVHNDWYTPHPFVITIITRP